MMDRYEELANAIILMAVRDYRWALRRLKRTADFQPAIRVKREVEQFLHSEWFATLTRIDGTKLLERLRLEAEV